MARTSTSAKQWYTYSDDGNGMRLLRGFSSSHAANHHVDMIQTYNCARQTLRPKRACEEEEAIEVAQKVLGRKFSICQNCGEFHASDFAPYCSTDCRDEYRAPVDDPDEGEDEDDGLHECPTCGVESTSLRCGCRPY